MHNLHCTIFSVERGRNKKKHIKKVARSAMRVKIKHANKIFAIFV